MITTEQSFRQYWRWDNNAGRRGRGRSDSRRRHQILRFLTWVGIGCLVFLALIAFQAAQEDMSYETVSALDAKNEAVAKAKEEERKDARLRRAKARTEAGSTTGADDDDAGIPLWRLIAMYMILRVWLRSRLAEEIDSNGSGGGTNSRYSFRQRYQNEQFRIWADRLNLQRLQLGLTPLSYESLSAAVRDDGDGSNYEALLRFREEAGQSEHEGATPQEIAALPMRTVMDHDPLVAHRNDDHQDDNSNNEASACSICLDYYQIGESVRTFRCTHTFHQQCIDTWLRQKSVCPICKHSVIRS
jgi:Ring finger domain